MSNEQLFIQVFKNLRTVGVIAFCICCIGFQFRTCYQEYQVEHRGIEVEAIVEDIPLEKSRRGPKEMLVKIGYASIPVKISGADYHYKRFKVGQSLKLNYDADTQFAMLSDGVDDDTRLSRIVAIGFVAMTLYLYRYKILKPNEENTH